MKRFRLGVVLGVVAVLAISACGNSGKDTSSTGDKGKKPVIGVSFYTKTIPMYVEMEQGMRDEAKKLGADISFSYADGQAANQTNQINNFITRQVDVILASPVDADALVPAYQAAKAAGIPIISVANKVADQYEDAYVGPDLADQAYQTMQRLIKGIGGSGNILLITGPPQIAFVQLQKKGWDKALAEAPGVKVVQTLVDPDLSTAQALNLANTGLAAHPDVKGVMASTDDIALGAVQAANERGIDPKDIFIAGWDGGKAAIEAIKAGTYDLTLSQRGYTWGQLAVQTAVDWVNGKKPAQHRVPSKDQFIDQQNVNTLTPEQMR